MVSLQCQTCAPILGLDPRHENIPPTHACDVKLCLKAGYGSTVRSHPPGGSSRRNLVLQVPDMNKVPFRARQLHPAVVMGVKPHGEEALRLVLVPEHRSALKETMRSSEKKAWTGVLISTYEGRLDHVVRSACLQCSKGNEYTWWNFFHFLSVKFTTPLVEWSLCRSDMQLSDLTRGLFVSKRKFAASAPASRTGSCKKRSCPVRSTLRVPNYASAIILCTCILFVPEGQANCSHWDLLWTRAQPPSK